MAGAICKRNVAAIIAIYLLIDEEEEPRTRGKTSKDFVHINQSGVRFQYQPTFFLMPF